MRIPSFSRIAGVRAASMEAGLPGRVERVEHRLLAAVHRVVAGERHDVEPVIQQQPGALVRVERRAVPQRAAEAGVQLAVPPVGQRLLQLAERDVPAAEQVADRLQVSPVFSVLRSDVAYGQECQGHAC
jgi:hypothetical protein